jgi:hypothetical protein
MDVVIGVCGWPSVWACIGERPAHRSGSGVESVACRPTRPHRESRRYTCHLDNIAHACGGGRGCYKVCAVATVTLQSGMGSNKRGKPLFIHTLTGLEACHGFVSAEASC